MTEQELIEKIAEAYITSGRDFGKVCIALIKEAGYKSPAEVYKEVKKERDRLQAIHSKPYPD